MTKLEIVIARARALPEAEQEQLADAIEALLVGPALKRGEAKTAADRLANFDTDPSSALTGDDVRAFLSARR